MKTDAKLTPVREAHRFDENALDLYLKNNLKGYAGSLKRAAIRRRSIQSDLPSDCRRHRICDAQETAGQTPAVRPPGGT